MFVIDYRPVKLDDMILDKSTRNIISAKFKHGTIDNFLLYGTQGIGKTTLAKLIPSEIGASYMYINAGYDSSVEVIRNKVKDFCDTRTINGLIKVVIIDEADSLSGTLANGTNAQSALKNLIEQSESDTRFVLTCNHIDKIIKPIQSRCFPIQLHFEKKDVLEKIVSILNSSNVTWNRECLTKFAKDVVNKAFPDVRIILNALDKWVVDGVLMEGVTINIADEPCEKLFVMIEDVSNKSADIRKWYLESEGAFSANYQDFASKLFNKYDHDLGKQLIVSEHVYRMSLCPDKELQFYTMIRKLRDV
jgi:replication-associated recombination protein RarA